MWKDDKVKAEKEIRDILVDLEKKTNLLVDNLRIQRIDITHNKGNRTIQKSVNIDLSHPVDYIWE